MATLQVKNLPDDLHAALRQRAVDEGVTVTDLVVRMLRRELARPSIDEWLEQVRRRPMREHDVDIEHLMDEVRGEFGT
ncbi:MAG: hypothetical protein M3P96_09145 [Actinomycetota bacterium]|nr:hypothetical protein [Actinomycetota bacterium]